MFGDYLTTNSFLVLVQFRRAESPMSSLAQGKRSDTLGINRVFIGAPCFTLTEQVFRAKFSVNYL